jgi:hypothetical protein
MRIAGRSSGLGWGLLILASVLVVVGIVGLTMYGGTVRPQQHEVEQVLPDDRFPS